VSHVPLMNCTTAQGIPWAMQRMIIPKPDDDLPLPAPVWTMIRPFSSVFVFIISSRAALIRFIFSLWRRVTSSMSWLLRA
jgi:hypothetical protein